jgi:hypothetical protein
MPRSLSITARPTAKGPPELSSDRSVARGPENSRITTASAAGALAPASITEPLKPGPILISIAEARIIAGLSRSAIYRQMAAGNIRAVKGGSRTLIVLQSLVQHLESLPPAKFRGSG